MIRGALPTAVAASVVSCTFVAPLDGLAGGHADSGAQTDASGDVGSSADTGGQTDAVSMDVPTIHCDGGFVACGGQCVDVASDGANCGRCGHACGGGKCSAGICQPLTIAYGQATPRDLVVVGSTVYFTNHDVGGSVSSCPIAGCTGSPQVLTSNLDRASGIVVSGTTVAFACFGSTPPDGGISNLGAGVFQCATSGCATPTPYSSTTGATVGVATDGTRVFWNDAGFGKIFSCPLAGCGGNPTVIAQGVGTPWYGIDVDASNVYFAGRGDGTVNACPKSGCANLVPVPIATGLTGPFDLAVDSDSVYFTAFDPNNMGSPSPVLRCPLSGCTGAPPVVAANQFNPSGVAVDASGVYWANYANGTTGAGSVAFCAKAGCPQGPTILASGQDGAFMVTLDADYVYWTNTSGGQVMRVAKP